LDHQKYQAIFKSYGDAIRINTPPEIPEWETLGKRVAAAKKVSGEIAEIKKRIKENKNV